MIYEKTNGKMILGNNEIELPKLDDCSFDLIFIDPPYVISQDSGYNKNGGLKKYATHSIDFGHWDKKIPNWNILSKHFFRLLKNGGTIISFYDIFKIETLKNELEKAGFKQPRIGSWIKKPVPINSKLNYLSNAKEFFISMVKKGNCTFNSEYDNGLYFDNLCKGHERLSHPTQKPISLYEKIIEKHTNIGDNVLDCFGGSGTTGFVCNKLNRKWTLIEKERNYFDIAKERLEKQKLQPSLF